MNDMNVYIESALDLADRSLATLSPEDRQVAAQKLNNGTPVTVRCEWKYGTEEEAKAAPIFNIHPPSAEEIPMDVLRGFAKAAEKTADVLINTKMSPEARKKVTEAMKNGCRLSLSFEVGQDDPLIKLDLIDDMERRQPLVECRGTVPQQH